MTCSKDSRVLFWGILGSKHEVQLKATVDMKKEQVVYNIIIFHLKVDMIFSQNWIHTWGGRFNKTDTLLLVAGVLDQVTSPPISSSCQYLFHKSVQVANMYFMNLFNLPICISSDCRDGLCVGHKQLHNTLVCREQSVRCYGSLGAEKSKC